MVRTYANHTPAGLETRGRPRERERRPAGTIKERSRSRERDFGRTGKRKSRSPPRNKIITNKSTTATVTSANRSSDTGRKSDQAFKVDRRNDPIKPNDTNQQTASSKLRMDRNRDRLKESKSDKEAHGSRKRLGELDRVVKRAREERSSYWNKRVLEAEEKDPNRWGHSGFKEMYRRDMKMGSHIIDPPSALVGTATSSPRGSSKQLRQDVGRSLPTRGRSRSKSPRNFTKSRNRQSPSPFNPRGTAPRPSIGSNRAASPFLDDFGSRRNKRRSNDKSANDSRRYLDRMASSKSGSRNVEEKNAGTNAYRGWSDKRENNRVRRKSRSGSLSRSRTRSSMSPPSKMKRSSNAMSAKMDPKGKDSWRGNINSMDTSTNRSRTRSQSSSSSSSEDGDVLELHAKSRRKGSSISSHSSTSSSDDSKSGSSSSSATSSKRKNGSGSSSSSSSSESDSDDDSDISGKIESRKSATSGGSSRLKEKEGTSQKGKSTGSESRLAAKRQSSGSSAVSSKVPRKTAPSDKAVAGDSDSDSGSSSDSDSEPRMTLSERFAKLTQMSTDKREFAKPVLAMNEIDTKLKVVKDLRNADVKIYTDGFQQQRGESSSSAKIRPKSPDYNYEDGAKRYSSDERRRHFERMARDEPRERPADWSDSRVRYEYYRDRGYFNDRPLSFEEYVKWEQWWYEYRDWLETEGYYPRVEGAVPRGNQPQMVGNTESSRGMRSGEWNHTPPGVSRMRVGPGQPPPRINPARRVEQVPVRMAPLSNRMHFIGRSEGRGRPPGHGSSQGRSIDRVPGGSLIVNIRQGSNYGPRGRHVGLVRGHQR